VNKQQTTAFLLTIIYKDVRNVCSTNVYKLDLIVKSYQLFYGRKLSAGLI